MAIASSPDPPAPEHGIASKKPSRVGDYLPTVGGAGPDDWWKGFVFLPVGLCVLAGGIAMAVNTRDFLAHSETVPGVVTAEEHGPAHIRVRFTTRAGRTVEYHQNGDVYQHTGDRVTVRYDPRAPEQDPALDSWGATWGGAAGVGGLGATFTLIGGGMLLARARRRGGR